MYWDKNVHFIKRLQKSDLINRLLEENASNLSEQEFKNYILQPFTELKSEDLTNEGSSVFLYYLNKYKSGIKDIYSALQEYSEPFKIAIISKFIKQDLMNKELYEELPDFANTLAENHPINLYNQIFRYEKNLDYLKMFEPKFLEMIKKDKMYLGGFSRALDGPAEKRNYIIKTFSIKEACELPRPKEARLLFYTDD